MNNIAVGMETLRIISEGKYQAGGREVVLPELDYQKAVVISPEEGQRLMEAGIEAYRKEKRCRIVIKNADSFEAGRCYENALVMNFANAHNPGGGFKIGATAQEESLCRCSTLYASITSKEASEMYHYNNTHLSSVESDYMLISPNVAVIRGEGYRLLEEPAILGVITAPAPNRRGAAVAASKKVIRETFLRRIRILLLAAMKHGYRNLVLGAWGCGAFGNPPKEVAGYFKTVIIDEGYGNCFDEICFAIYGKEDGRNITAFREEFAE